MDVAQLVHGLVQVGGQVHVPVEDGVGGVVVDLDPLRADEVHDLLQNLSAAVVAVDLQHQGEAVFFQLRHQGLDMLGHLGVGGHHMVGQVGLLNGGDDVVAAEEGGEADVGDEVRDAGGVHQVAVAAHGEGDEALLGQAVLHAPEPFKALVGEDVLCPALGGGELDIVEAGGGDGVDGLLDGIAVVAVGVDRDDAL